MSTVIPESVLSTYTASDGDNLAVQDWPLPEGRGVRGLVLIVHGLGEHAGRYDHVARQLNQWGFAVRSYDQYGHGESGGVRGASPQKERLVTDLGDLVESCRRRMEPGLPLLLLGHSLGGLVTASFVVRGIAPVEGLILSSPALATRMNALQKLLLAIIPRVAPNLTVNNGVDAKYLSHDPAVVAAYRTDPRVHDRISGRLARFIVDEGQSVVAQAGRWRVPTLLLYAGADRLIDPAGSRAFAAAAPRETVSAHCCEQLYHEIFNEVEKEAVFSRLRQWLDARF